MNGRREFLEPVFCEFMPETLEEGKLYVSQKFKTATHLCCCGCGNKVVTPLKPSFWNITIKGNTVTLSPSIGSFSLPCRSHYFIRDNKVVWCG